MAEDLFKFCPVCGNPPTIGQASLGQELMHKGPRQLVMCAHCRTQTDDEGLTLPSNFLYATGWTTKQDSLACWNSAVDRWLEAKEERAIEKSDAFDAYWWALVDIKDNSPGDRTCEMHDALQRSLDAYILVVVNQDKEHPND